MNPRENRLPWMLVVALVLVVGAALVVRGRRTATAIVAYENEAIAALSSLLAAQQAWHARHGRYATLSQLAAEGSLPEGRQVERADGPALVTEGYFVEVLLPEGRTADGGIRLGRDEAGANAALLAGSIALVARPRQPASTGYQMYYTDERGSLYVSDGVSDEDGLLQNRPPRLHLGRTPRSVVSQMGWDPQPWPGSGEPGIVPDDDE